METAILNNSLSVQNLFLQRIQHITADKFSDVEIKTREKLSIHATEYSSRKNNYILKIELRNKINDKIINFSYYDGYTCNKNLCYDFNLVLKATGYQRKLVSIKEYFKYFNISHKFNNFIPQQGPEDLLKQLNIFLEDVEKLFIHPQMQAVLFTDAWIDIPIDFSEYK